MVFETLIIEEPSKKEQEKGKLETIIAGPTILVAEDAEAAKVSALLNLKNFDGDKAKIRVLVRPFK